MRKAEIEQICNIIRLLEQAHEAMGKNIAKQNIQPVLELLVDCQETAIAIGSKIEQVKEFETAVVESATEEKKPQEEQASQVEKKLQKENKSQEEKRELGNLASLVVFTLEKYCETMYQLFEKLVAVQSVKNNQHSIGVESFEMLDFSERLIALNDLLSQIKTEIIDNIKIRKIAVFLPYKASMWDSLESVWKAADEDPDCDAYVIPIPYFDRNADGALGEMRYEGDLYPSYVPVTSYEEFDLEEQKPDLIFIHNPYDEYNRVTSVHPNFYSSKLKDYTDSLVYIPYFILGEIEPENEDAVQGMEHFCKTPAVLNAHKVIVQSEKMKQVYVKVLTEWQGEHTKALWEEKILGLGSPKVDKVLNTRKKDLVIPEDWLRIIEKPDGSWKKVIFYNTSLSTMLQNSDQYLDKVEDVLRIFKENKDEVALLWRPHPLFMQTIESMRPELKERYIEVVRKFKAEEWGIYDDSVELDRAVVVSDGYYGDWSSVVWLYEKTGKPILIKDINILEEI